MWLLFDKTETLRFCNKKCSQHNALLWKFHPLKTEGQWEHPQRFLIEMVFGLVYRISTHAKVFSVVVVSFITVQQNDS
jgi:hypothetical protein